jgi:hypothetical protein
MPRDEFPVDGAGNPLCWPDPEQPDWYVDAWNGIYPSREFALRETQYWTAKEEDRILSFGEGIVDECEAERRLGLS